MQKRLARKLDLELLLLSVKPHPSPKANLEQYTISADAAATILYIAAYANNDVIGKRVLDLGCGTGRLALAAAFLGAREVVGVDIDKTAVKVAYENSVRTGLQKKMSWIVGDIDAVEGSFDTVLQNPPFGVQKRGADRRFLEKALKSGNIVYSLHKSLPDDMALVRSLKARGNNAIPVSPSPFLKGFIEKNGGKIMGVYALVMTIPHMFSFHTRRKHEFAVDLYIVEKKREGHSR